MFLRKDDIKMCNENHTINVITNMKKHWHFYKSSFIWKIKLLIENI